MKSRSEVIDIIAASAIRGRLGLFVGTGFSKALTNGLALTFRELLIELVKELELGVNIDNDKQFRHKSHPQIASEIVKKHVEQSLWIDDKTGDLQVKQAASSLCNLLPDEEIRTKFYEELKTIRPSWVITTNYDLVLESVFPNNHSLLSHQPIMPNQECVPIFHLHGNRLYPQSLRITEEDYVSLLGPLDYQRIRLPLLLLESTTLMIGYALGDINVRAALEWARSFVVDDNRQEPDQGLIVQALFKENGATTDVKHGPNGEIILETDNLLSFLSEVATSIVNAQELNRFWQEIREEYLRNRQNDIYSMTNGSEERNRFLYVIENLPFISNPTSVISFLDSILGKIWQKARENGGWEYYNMFLELILDVLVRIDIGKNSPTVFGYLAQMLSQIGSFIGPAPRKNDIGIPWRAAETWETRKDELGEQKLRELRSLSRSQNLWGIKILFGESY